MNDTSDSQIETLGRITAELVAAYVSNNSVPPSELPALIARVHGAISGLVSGIPAVETGAAAQVDVEKPGAAQIHTHFLEMGIESLLMIRATQVLEDKLGVRVSVVQLYRALGGGWS